MVNNEGIIITARSLSGGDPECLGGHPHWTLHLELLVLGSPDQVLAHLLQRLHVPGGQGDPDPVDRRLLLNSLSILDKILLSCMLNKNLDFTQLGVDNQYSILITFHGIGSEFYSS